MKTFPVRELWLPNGAQDDSRLGRLARVAAAEGVSVRWLSSDTSGWARGDLDVDVLWPPPRTSHGGTHTGPAKSRNDGSLVLAVARAGTRMLFAADIGAEVERQIVRSGERLDADILKVGHHGSRHSTTADFLAAVSPHYAVVSAPCDPARGLPNQLILARLEAAGARLAWTGRDGAASFDLLPQPIGGGWIDWAPARSCRGRDSRPIGQR